MSRFGIGQISERLFKSDFPLGTLLANIIGCLLIGVLLGSGRSESSQVWRLAFGVGFLGALTTFSTFGAETVRSVNEGSLPLAFANVVANVVIGLVAVFVGIWIGKSMLPAVGEV